MKPHWPYLASLLVFSLGMGTLTALDRAWTGERLAQQRHEVSARLSALRDGIESELQSRLAPATGLVALVAHSPDLDQDEFERAAKKLVESSPGVRSVSLARDSIVSHVYPFAPNHKALGLNLLEHPKQGEAVRLAISQQRSILSGPVDLVQGGRAFIGRIPIYLGEPTARPWGLATVLIDSDLFLERTVARSAELRLLFQGADAKGDEGRVFYGDEAVRSGAPIIVDVVVPGGSWKVAAVPAGGWVTAPHNAFAKRALGVALVLLLAALTFVLFLGYRRLVERTYALAEALGEVRTLKGLLPVCSNCKSVRDDRGLWSRIERYIEENSNLEVTHSICPTCLVELYGPEMAARVLAASADDGEEREPPPV